MIERQNDQSQTPVESELDPLLDTFEDTLCNECGEPLDDCICGDEEDSDEDDDG